LKPLFEKVACQEGFTLRESLSGQLMHSQVGPWTEANAVYVDQSKIEVSKKVPSTFVLYDIGMGTAANALALIEKWGDEKPLRIVSFEKYPESLEMALGMESDFPFLKPWKSDLRTLLDSKQIQRGNIEWNLVSDDFVSADFETLPKPDLVYFDFYSPAICPELWTEEVFSRVRETPRLVTYASNKSVRVAMLLAGLYVGKGASTSMKLETTIAGSKPVENLLSRDWVESLERSAKKFPMDRLRAHPQFS
jgi:tRNA U34 5-methylaminomethyl-2-thiouridine-forming methyltransferase MnmC